MRFEDDTEGGDFMRFLRKLSAAVLGGAVVILWLISSQESADERLYKTLFTAAMCLYVGTVLWSFVADIRDYSVVKESGTSIKARCESNEAALFWRSTRYINFIGQTHPELSAEIDGERASVEPIGWFDESVCKKGDVVDVLYWNKKLDFVILPGQKRQRAFVVSRVLQAVLYLAVGVALAVLLITQG